MSFCFVKHHNHQAVGWENFVSRRYIISIRVHVRVHDRREDGGSRETMCTDADGIKIEHDVGRNGTLRTFPFPAYSAHGYLVFTTIRPVCETVTHISRVHRLLNSWQIVETDTFFLKSFYLLFFCCFETNS